MKDLKEYIVNESRQNGAKELKEAGINDIQFYNYEDLEDKEIFSKERYGDPKKYEKSFEEKLKSNDWKCEEVKEPKAQVNDKAPSYFKSFAYSKNGWNCIFFSRYGYGLDGATIWFYKSKK